LKHTKLFGSSNVDSAGYDPEKLEMEVRFLNGDTYVYSAVPAGIHAGLLLAPSAGSYLHQHVKGKFNYRKKD